MSGLVTADRYFLQVDFGIQEELREYRRLRELTQVENDALPGEESWDHLTIRFSH